MLRFITTFKMYGVKVKIKVFILIFCVSSAVTQTCDTISDVTQCSEGEICRNNVCEDDSVVSNVEEGSEHTLTFQEPATPGSYEEIQWYKGGRYSLDRLAIFLPVITDNKPQYYNDFCSGNSPCRTSDRAHLNRDTGELTIHSIKFSDEGFYYYQFYIPNGIPDTGVIYEYTLNVYVLTIEGVPSDYVAVGTNLTLTCTVDRIKPLPLAMYWEINGKNVTGTVASRVDDGDGVFNQTVVYIHRVTKEDEVYPIKCVLVPRYGQTITVEKTLNSGYGPSGRPTVQASVLEQYNGERVTLTCNNPTEDGNPDCNVYTWRRLEGNINFTPETQIYTFIMDEFHAGNYTCQCRNEFGESEVSDEVEMLYLGESFITEHKDNNGGLIAGCVIGVLVLAALVIVGVVVCKRYKVKFNMNLKFQPRRERAEHEVNNDNVADNGGYEDPVNNNANPYEEVNNGVNNVNLYQDVNNGGNNGNQFDVINDENNGNQYDVINEDAMAMPRGAGFVNPGMTTYEEVL